MSLEANKRYFSTAKGKLARSRAIQNYNRSPKGQERQRLNRVSSYRNFLSYKFRFIKHKKSENNIDVDYLVAIYQEQNGKCKISNVPMTHQYNDLCSISIDRIDSTRGYVRGNVQLLCRAINLAKQHLPNQEMIDFIQKVRANG